MQLSTLLLILTTWIQFLLGTLICCNILRVEISIKKIVCVTLLTGIINSLPIYNTNFSIVLIFIITISTYFLICKILFKLPFSKCLSFLTGYLLHSATIECVMIIVNIVISGSQNFFFSHIRENTYLNILRFLSLLPCFLIYAVSNFVVKKREISYANKESFTIIVLNFFFLIAFIYPNIIYFEHFEIKINNFILLYDLVLALCFVIYSIYNSINSYELGKKAVISANQKLYTETLENSLDQIKGFRHEMNNIISTIAGFVELERLDLLRPYIGDLQQRLTAQSSTNVLNLNLREVPILYGLLIGKINYATNMGVRFEIAIVTKEEIVFPNEVLYDLAYIMGVWLDNAIEAAAASELKQVNLLVRDDSDCYNIVVRNSFEGEVDLKKIKRKNYSTKSNYMGIGLHQVEEKVQAQSKYFSSSTTINECSFIQHLQVKK